MSKFKDIVERMVEVEYGVSMEQASVTQLYNAVSRAAMQCAREKLKKQDPNKKEVCYLSAEFLIGRMVYNNLLNLGLMDEFSELMRNHNLNLSMFEEIEDAALGNGGLGRLAACFLDSGATLGIQLNGYGIRYKYGLFKQYFEDGFQREMPDDWQKYLDPWSVRKEEEKVIIRYKNQTVYAVPYDNPVIGYGKETVNNLRLWQAEPVVALDFERFNEQKYEKAFKNKNEAEAISALLYPNDSTNAGKQLRLKQQYFFVSASIQDMIRKYKQHYQDQFVNFSNIYAIQLNDTHPVVAIPELVRLLVEEEKISFERAFEIAQRSFAYTNHTVMAEALEKWDVTLFKSVIPKVYQYIVLINKKLIQELTSRGYTEAEKKQYQIIDKTTIHMVRLAVYGSHSINGVAQIHTDILKNDTLKEWYLLFPERFNNKTNGITQRRWLALSNMELSDFITKRIGNSWITNLMNLKKLESYKNDNLVLKEFDHIKQIKKVQLADYIHKKDHIIVNPNAMFDIQVKRLHEYKRQLLNAFSILDIYFGMKEGRIVDFYPTVFIFGAKAAPGYMRAKGIIKFINEIAKMIQEDDEVNQILQIVFISNYNVSYAEKIVPAADVSEQISTAGTEASGTGNMKFMLNGAVTLGTYDGANVEIVQQAGAENNYIFGARVEQIQEISKNYNARDYYEHNPRLKRVVDTLIDGTLKDGGTGMFRELYDSLLEGASWHKPDHYYLFLDFESYVEAKLRTNNDYKKDLSLFRRKCFLNMVHAGIFSSDRTICEYAKDIWEVL